MTSSELEQVEVKRGYWLYDSLIRKTVLILRLNYDVYFESEKDDGVDMTNEIPILNSEGYSYVVAWPTEDFALSTGSWSIPPDDRALSPEGTMDYAQEVVRQPIEWFN